MTWRLVFLRAANQGPSGHSGLLELKEAKFQKVFLCLLDLKHYLEQMNISKSMSQVFKHLMVRFYILQNEIVKCQQELPTCQQQTEIQNDQSLKLCLKTISQLGYLNYVLTYFIQKSTYICK